jgi:predicted RNase H-like nuclease (RuvC/YqgF family)
MNLNKEIISLLYAKSLKREELLQTKCDKLIDRLADKIVEVNSLNRDISQYKRLIINKDTEINELKDELKEAYEDVDLLEYGLEIYRGIYEQECIKAYKEYM